MEYVPASRVTRHTYTPENGMRGLQFTWYEGAERISVHRPATAGGFEVAAFTYVDGPATAETFPSICDRWADQRQYAASIVSIPIEDEATGVAFGSVGHLVWRDNVNGERFTAHVDSMNGTGWIVRHQGHTSASDGRPVMRSEIMPSGTGVLAAAWHMIRTGERQQDACGQCSPGHVGADGLCQRHGKPVRP